MVHKGVLVVDFGGQYTQLIVRRVRELGIFSEAVPYHKFSKESLENVVAVILSGGPRSVLEDNAPTIDFSLIPTSLPVLGICYGHQFLAHVAGGKVESAIDREYGKRLLNIVGDGLVTGMKDKTVWMSHGDQVISPPFDCTITATTDTCPVAAFESTSRLMFGVQFHPEVSHTPSGFELLRQFLIERAHIAPNWDSASFIQDALAEIKSTVGNKRVLCGVSGGVDSSVVAALMHEAIGDQLTCVFIDHGLLRKDEAASVVETFSQHFHPKLVAIDAREQFLTALKGITDPEEKRKIVGAEFVRAFEVHASEFSDCEFLAQGTLYPDIIESGLPHTAKIKTHHNVGGLPDWMKLRVIEPVKWLFKDEVRAVGRALGLPEEMIDREPFPGPGLAVRILGEITAERVKIVQDADAIFREELRARGLHKEIWQSYAALLDIRSVGVMGDERTYQQPIVLRAVQSEDAMTAQAVNIPFDALEAISTRIVNEVAGINRVLYDLTSKPPATIEWE